MGESYAPGPRKGGNAPAPACLARRNPGGYPSDHAYLTRCGNPRHLSHTGILPALEGKLLLQERNSKAIFGIE